MSEAKLTKLAQYSKDTLRLQIIDSKNNPISDAEVILLAMGQKQGQRITLQNKTNYNGLTSIDLQPYIKHINRFEITINHPKYYTYPTNRTRKICRSYEYGHLCVEKFDKIPTFYFKDNILNISQNPNFIKQYELKSACEQKAQEQKEYYIQLQSSQKSLTIYKDKNLAEKSEYELHLECLQDNQQNSQNKDSNRLYFNNNEVLEKFKDEIESIIAKNSKKGNTQSIHKIIFDYNKPDLIEKALQFIDEFEKRNIKGVFLDDNLTELEKEGIEHIIGSKNPFDKSIIISILKERIVNLVTNHNHKTKATLPTINNPTNFYYPDQCGTSLCGPATFFYCLLMDRPDLYVKCVIDLWENGETNIKRLKIKTSNSCKKPKSLIKEYNNEDIECINGVDWITLAGLRDSANVFHVYDEVNDKLAGITLGGALEKWFESVGAKILFSNVTYGTHINKKQLIKLVEEKQQNQQSYVVALIDSKLLINNKKLSIKYKNHWIVWNTLPEAIKEGIKEETKDSVIIEQKVVSWGNNQHPLAKPYSLKEYLTYQFGAMIISKIPYILGEYE